MNETRAEEDFTFYTIIAEDYIIDGESYLDLSEIDDSIVAKNFPIIVDSGYSTNVLPPSLVDRFYDAFDERPRPIEFPKIDATMFGCPCDVNVPDFGVKIGGKVLKTSRESILVSRVNTTIDGVAMCMLGIQPGIERAGALGDPFLSGVVAVFDVGSSEMRFAQRDQRTTRVEDGSELSDHATSVKDEL